jgi:hypothetical protein
VEEAVIVWLVAIGLTLAALGFGAVTSRRWRERRHPDLGWMSVQWIAEYRAGSH